MFKTRRTAAKFRSVSFRPAAARVDHLDAATRSKGPWFNSAAVIRNHETLFQQMYRRRRAGLPLDRFMTELRAPAPHAASSAESYS
jgi:hypothetical protein